MCEFDACSGLGLYHRIYTFIAFQRGATAIDG